MPPVPDPRCEPGRAEVDRWRTSAAVLGEVRRAPGLTRVELAERLGLSSATTTETVTRLREAGWLAEERAPVSGRGRPTTRLVPCPDGPVVLALDLRHEEWRLAVAGLDGVPTLLGSGRRPAGTPELATEVATAVAAWRGRRPADGTAGGAGGSAGAGARPRALAVAVPTPLSDDAVVRATALDWAAVGVDRLGAVLGEPAVPVLLGNDATLAGLAEARAGAAAGAGTALSLTLEVGLGGALLLDGRPQLGAHGAAGEFGHLPMGDPAIDCPCGALGCWGRELDGGALARHLGLDPPADPRTFADEVLDRADAGDGDAAGARDRVAAALGRGVAGLVNAHDPEVVVLGGFGPRLLGPTFAEAYLRGLVRYRRDDPVPVRASAFGDDAALVGAVALALDDVTSAEALARGGGRSQAAEIGCWSTPFGSAP